jgi:hypothetical protein
MLLPYLVRLEELERRAVQLSALLFSQQIPVLDGRYLSSLLMVGRNM